MPTNPFEPRLEHQLTQHANARHLEALHAAGQFDQLLQAAQNLNRLYSLERIKTDWAIREASQNLSALCGYDRDSC
jgi:putative heme iron utilization protein